MTDERKKGQDAAYDFLTGLVKNEPDYVKERTQDFVQDARQDQIADDRMNDDGGPDHTYYPENKKIATEQYYQDQQDDADKWYAFLAFASC